MAQLTHAVHVVVDQPNLQKTSKNTFLRHGEVITVNFDFEYQF